MTIRIGSGTLKGSKLMMPKGKGIRPPLARIRKSVCDILSPRFPGARALDLYAGSGSFGIEAVSRGAAVAVMVEQGREASAAIAENVRRLNIEDRVIIIQREAGAALKELAAGGHRFDIIFMDPPFSDFRPEAAEQAGSLLEEGGIMLLRTAKAAKAPADPASLTLVRVKRYGISRVNIYEKGGMK